MSEPERNPMGGYRDIYRWKYDWSRDIAPDIISALTIVSAIFDGADYWTYENHWSWYPGELATPWNRIVDIFWEEFDEPRQQMPPPVGDLIAALLVNQLSNRMRLLLWFGQAYTPGVGWWEYNGPQGDFVDHLHVEFNESTE